MTYGPKLEALIENVKTNARDHADMGLDPITVATEAADGFVPTDLATLIELWQENEELGEARSELPDGTALGALKSAVYDVLYYAASSALREEA